MFWKIEQKVLFPLILLVRNFFYIHLYIPNLLPSSSLVYRHNHKKPLIKKLWLWTIICIKNKSYIPRMLAVLFIMLHRTAPFCLLTNGLFSLLSRLSDPSKFEHLFLNIIFSIPTELNLIIRSVVDKFSALKFLI